MKNCRLIVPIIYFSKQRQLYPFSGRPQLERSDYGQSLRRSRPGDRDCAKRCVTKGAKFVFVNDADKNVYALDSQVEIVPHAVEHVMVKGTAVSHTLKLSYIE